MQEIVIDTNKQKKISSICCYVCGREFGTKGFAFHYKECLTKFSNQQKKKPIKEQIKLPQAPQELKQILSGELSQIDLKKFNEQSAYLFKNKILPACKFCKRTFNPQSLSVHIKGCSKKPLGYQQKENQLQINPKIPKALVCCVCGQRFGTASLRIHYPECIKKFNNEEFRKHKKSIDRKKAPEYSPEDAAALLKQEWTEQQIQSFNDRATNNFRNKGMAQCDNCARKFFFDQLEKHRKNCQLINGKVGLGQPLPQKRISTKASKPIAVICFICGRQYGTNSIAIHSVQCQSMFKKIQENKPAGERKAMPVLSQQVSLLNLNKAQSWTKQQLQQYNKKAFQCYNNKSLSKCYICKRTFFEESLPKHLKNCESQLKDVKKLEKLKKSVNQNKSFFGDNFLENVMEINRQLSHPQIKETKKPRSLMCLLCGKQFGPASLKIHIPQCRGQNQQKKLELNEVIQDIKGRYNINQAETWNQQQITAYNKQVYEIYKKQSLFECKYCHRTFFEQSLQKHIKHCQKENKKKKTLKRSQTVAIIHYEQPIQSEIETELDQSIPFIKLKSEHSLMEIIEDQEQNHNCRADKQKYYHALEYGSLMHENNDQFSQTQQSSKIENEQQQMIAESFQNTLQGIENYSAMEVQDFD